MKDKAFVSVLYSGSKTFFDNGKRQNESIRVMENVDPQYNYVLGYTG